MGILKLLLSRMLCELLVLMLQVLSIATCSRVLACFVPVSGGLQDHKSTETTGPGSRGPSSPLLPKSRMPFCTCETKLEVRLGNVQCVQSPSSEQVRAQRTGESAMNLSEFLQSFCQQPRNCAESSSDSPILILPTCCSEHANISKDCLDIMLCLEVNEHCRCMPHHYHSESSWPVVNICVQVPAQRITMQARLLAVGMFFL